MKKLSHVPVQHDIIYGSNVVASAYRLDDGRWNFHILKNDYWEESADPLDLEQLVKAYRAIRRRSRARLKATK